MIARSPFALNSLLFDAILVGLFFLVLSLLFGCSCVSTQEPPAAHRMFSVRDPQHMSDNQRKMLQEIDMMAEHGHHLSGVPVHLRLIVIDDKAVEATKQAVHMAMALNKPLLVDLDGFGGRVMKGFEIFTTISKVEDVRCVVLKESDSMNAFLYELLPCRRGILADAKLTFHHPAVDIEPDDTAADLVRKASVEEELVTGLCNAVATATEGSVSAAQCHINLHQNDERTWTVSGREAVALHLADYLLDLKGYKP